MSLKKHENGGLSAPFHNWKTQAGPIASTLSGYELLMTVVKSRGVEGEEEAEGVIILQEQFWWGVDFIQRDSLSWRLLEPVRPPSDFPCCMMHTVHLLILMRIRKERSLQESALLGELLGSVWWSSNSEISGDYISQKPSFFIKPSIDKIVLEGTGKIKSWLRH